MVDVSKEGVPALMDFVELAAKAGIAFDLDFNTAGEKLGELKTKFELTTNEARELLDVINYIGDRTSTTGKKVIATLGWGFECIYNKRFDQRAVSWLGWCNKFACPDTKKSS
jgi:hypothetical protein